MQTVVNKKSSQPVSKAKPPKGSPRPALWTVDEYYKMYDEGLFRSRRVQLIRGEIIEMSPMNSPHATAVKLTQEALMKLFQDGFVVQTQLPLHFGKIDEPEPDVAVIQGSIRDFTESHPTTALLLVEIADSSLRFDRRIKSKLYAENGVQEYWIVNLRDRCIEIYRNPSAGPGGAEYGESTIATETMSVSPLAKPKAKIKVADILP